MKLNVTIPVYNGQDQIESCVRRVLQLAGVVACDEFELVIAENGSTDGTALIARDLERMDARVHLLSLPAKGRGRALRAAWTGSSADIVSYMDVDLSSDLTDFARLIAPILAGTHDVVVGSRLLSASQTTRGWRRETVSRLYSLLARLALPLPCHDLQCGFKAVSRRAIDALVPLVEDDAWFFDTELLYLAGQAGYPVLEIPIRWTESSRSTVRIARTAWEDLKGLGRLRLGSRARRLTRAWRERRSSQDAGRTSLSQVAALHPSTLVNDQTSNL